MSAEPDAVAPDRSGDPVCWLHRLCAECGAVPAPEVPDRCWRCGAARAGTGDEHAVEDTGVRGPSGASKSDAKDWQ